MPPGEEEMTRLVFRWVWGAEGGDGSAWGSLGRLLGGISQAFFARSVVLPEPALLTPESAKADTSKDRPV